MRKVRNQFGLTLLEMLITVFLSGILMTAGLKFYSTMQSQTTSQMELSNVQSICRCSMDEIKSALRDAGFMLTTHDAYFINGDTLMVYYKNDSLVDTMGYFLAEDQRDDDINGESAASPTYRLMKREINGRVSIYADNIIGISYREVSANRIEITITAQSELWDEAYNFNNGYRRYTLSEEVYLRNI